MQLHPAAVLYTTVMATAWADCMGTLYRQQQQQAVQGRGRALYQTCGSWCSGPPWGWLDPRLWMSCWEPLLPACVPIPGCVCLCVHLCFLHSIAAVFCVIEACIKADVNKS